MLHFRKNPCTSNGDPTLYKRSSYHQFGLDDFNQPAGFKMNLENRWVRKAETIPWAEIEDKYAELRGTVSEQYRHAGKTSPHGSRIAADPEAAGLLGPRAC